MIFTKTQKIIKNIEDDIRGMRNLKKTSFVLIFVAIGVLILSNFRGVTFAAPAQDNSQGTFYDNFTDATGITTTGSAEFDTYQNNIRLADNNNASLLFRGQNGSLVKQAKIRNGYLYVAACAAGVLIYDLADPADPLLVGQYNTPGCPQDIDFYGDYAVVADEYNSDTGVQPPIAHQGGLQIIDISDPTNPTFVSSSDNGAGGYSFGVTVNSHYVYIESIIVGTNTGYLDVFDLSDISSPQLVKSVLNAYGLRWRSGLVSGNYLYTAADRPGGGAGMHVFNVSDPANPIEVGSYITGVGTYAPVSKVGDYVYLPVKTTGVVIVDVSNPTNPSLVATVDTPDSAGNVVVSGGYGYVADRYSGLQIFDTTTNLIVGSYNTPDQAYDVDLYNNYVYVIDHSSIQVINISDPTNPTLTKEIKSLEFGSYTGLAVSGNYAYVAQSNGMTVYSISDPYNPDPIGEVYLSSSALGVAVSGNYAYVANGADGLKVINVSDKVNPTTTGSLDTSGTANKVAVSGNYAYVADGASGLQVIDISVPASPTSTTTLATAHYAYGVDLYDNYILSAEGTAGFRIVDITDPTNPVVTATIDTPGTTQRVVASGNYAYVADTTSFRIYDISTIAAPVLKGTIATTNTNSVAVGSSDYVFVSSQNYGTGPSSQYLTIDVSDLDNPIVVDEKYTTGDSMYVAASGDYLYAADGDSGIAVFSYGYTIGSSGQITSSTITPTEVGSWDKIVLTHTLDSQTINYQVLDSNGTLIPDSVLPGNAAGFSASGTSMIIDLHTLLGTTYPIIKIKANLSTTSKIFSPSADSWEAYWIKAKAGNDITSNGFASFDGSSSVGDSYTCAWDFDVSDGINWNTPDSASCQATYDYTSKGGGSYTATLRIKQGTATAYDYDTKIVTVTVGSGGSTPSLPPSPIPTIINLSINPSSLQVNSTSQSILTAEVFDQFNNHLTNGTLINWNIVSGSGSLASVSTSTTNGLASNTYTAGAQAGDVVIKACTTNLKCDQKTITLNIVQAPSVLTTISISPINVNIQVNGIQQFTATAKDQYSQTMSGVNHIWHVSDENLASITNAGLLTAKNAGAVNVVVSSGFLSDHAQVTITSLSVPPIPIIPPTPKPPISPAPTPPTPSTPTPGITPTPTPTTPGAGTITPPSSTDGGSETGTDTGADTESPNESLSSSPTVFQQGKEVFSGSIVTLVTTFNQAKELYQTKILKNKIVQRVNQRATLPVIATASVLNVATTVPAVASTLPLLQYLSQLLRFLFTQPAYLFARRRKSWGTVYDAITKQPIGLAMVRLYELVPSLTEQGSIKKLVQTKVTGLDGRYFLAVKSNTDYQLEVHSVDYNFPSKYFNQQPSDRLYPNLYYGSVFRSGSDGLVNFNLPLDLQEGKTTIAGSTKKFKSSFANLDEFSRAPQDEKEKAYHQLKRQANLRKLARWISYLSPSLALLNLIISPNALTLIFFFIHVALLFIFRIFNPNIFIKPLGKTFNLKNQESVGQSLVYLFEPQFNKLIQTQIADAQGQYGFLIGDEKYYLVAQKPGYIFPQDKVEIIGQTEGIAKKDLGLRKI